MAITTLPTPPSRSDPANFAERADDFLGALPTFGNEANALATAVNADAASALASKNAAQVSENNAEASANAALAVAGAEPWTSGETYQVGDAVFSLIDLQTYRANTITSGTVDPSLSADWTVLAIATIRTPEITSPLDNAIDILPTPTIEGTAYAPLYSADARDYRQLQIDTLAGNFDTPVVDIQENADNIEVTTPLDIDTEFKARIRDVSVNGVESAFSPVIQFKTVNITINEPTLTVEGSPDEVPESPTLTTSAFATTPTGEDTHLNTDWQVLEGETVVFESLADTSNKLSIVVPSGILDVDTTYTFRARHRGAIFGVSSYATVVATTLAAFELQIGDAFEGGFFAGIIANGVYQRVVVAPLASGQSATILQYKNTSDAAPAATQTLNNGSAATAAMVAAGNSTVYPAAHFCNNLTIGGFSDWYLPARDELELCYRNLKPTTGASSTSARSLSAITYPEGNDVSGDTQGINRNSDPTGAAYTSGNPAQTSVSVFQTGGTEAFAADTYWSSSEFSASDSWRHTFTSGFQFSSDKGNLFQVRAVRRLPIGPAIGEFYEGGYVAGMIKVSGVVYYVIVAPKATGQSATNLQYKTTNDASPTATQTLNDGVSATAAMVTAGSHPAANFCDGLTINGYSDWYLPARDELELCYRNLKPDTTANSTSNRALSTITYPEGNDVSADIVGVNRNSVSVGSGYAASGYPFRTNVALFQDGGTEAFAAGFYWSSSEFSAAVSWTQLFSTGSQNDAGKGIGRLVRAVRRVAVE
jgi:hypothetical protein